MSSDNDVHFRLSRWHESTRHKINMNRILREHNEALIMAEAEKQQGLSIKETEKNALQEKLNNATQNIQDLENEYEKLKRQANSKNEKDRATINQITQELKDFRTQFELATEAHEREIKGLNDACKQVHAMRDAAMKEVEELKLQLRMVEDARDGVRRDLIEAQRKVRETEEARDRQRKENLELRRGINDECHEKQTVSKTNDQLRTQVKKAEQERIS
uniref:Uncharacterized protein n=1 Tax=Ciona intestinalis TaxID=7719 RepID=H2XQ82_CIOIN